MKLLLRFILISLIIYLLLWAVYGMEYWHSRNTILSHYGGIGIECSPGGLSPKGQLTLYKSAIYIPFYARPFYVTSNFDYIISTKNGGTAIGYVTVGNKLIETNPGYACTLE